MFKFLYGSIIDSTFIEDRRKVLVIIGLLGALSSVMTVVQSSSNEGYVLFLLLMMFNSLAILDAVAHSYVI